MIPVSYTHLDVYKRQVLHRSIRAFEQDPLVTEIVLVAGKNRAFVEQQAADCTKPVQIVTCLLYTSRCV